jgi:hypothetical protein
MSLAVSAPARSDNLRGILAMLAAMGSLIATWVGIAIVTGAGLYTLVREHRLAKAQRA